MIIVLFLPRIDLPTPLDRGLETLRIDQTGPPSGRRRLLNARTYATGRVPILPD